MADERAGSGRRSSSYPGVPKSGGSFKGTGWGPTKRRYNVFGGRMKRSIPDAGAGKNYLSAFGPDGSAPPRSTAIPGGTRHASGLPGVKVKSSDPLRQTRTGFPPGPKAPIDVTGDPQVPKTELLKRFVGRRNRNG